MDMLHEIRAIRQLPGEPRRRWFFGSRMDLTVWTDTQGEIIGFQLSYDKPRAEKALTWKRDSRFFHNRVDDGESKPGRHKGTPLLGVDGLFDAPTA